MPDLAIPPDGPGAPAPSPPGGEAEALLALMLGALATGETRLDGLPDTAPVADAAAALRQLGVPVERVAPGGWRIAGRGVGGLAEPEAVLRAGASAALAGLLAGLVAGHDLFAVIEGTATGGGEGPPAALAAPLSAAGACLAGRVGGGLPLAVRGSGGLLPLDLDPAPADAANRAALVLAALCARGASRFALRGEEGPVEGVLRAFIRPRAETVAGRRILWIDGQPELAGRALAMPFAPPDQAPGPQEESAMPEATRPVIAIDGPAAAGKGTLARRLAAELGLAYLDTGLLYRAVGRRVLDAGGDPGDPAVAEAAALALEPGDLSRPGLRAPETDSAASRVAAIPGVRAALLDFQRSFARRQGAVLDGRDIGTVVFPEAAAKLFVTASPAERARRRWQERQGRGEAVTLEAVAAEMAARDARDAARDAAPMAAAPDAALLDTTGLDAEAAFATALALVRDRLRGAADGG